MSRPKGIKNKPIVKSEITEEKKVTNIRPVVCGHEEVRTENGVKLFKCGSHGEHSLDECQTLCAG